VHLAQVNVGRLHAAEGAPVVAEFFANLEPINRLAEQSPGFVWRNVSPSGEGHTTPTGEDELLVINLSVWERYEDLHAFAYRSAHNGFLRRRLEWFERMPGPVTALWWVEEGTEPTVEHALLRLERLREHGPSPQAFSLLRQYDADGRPVSRRSRAD
jgi:hypothetical protein